MRFAGLGSALRRLAPTPPPPPSRPPTYPAARASAFSRRTTRRSSPAPAKSFWPGSAPWPSATRVPWTRAPTRSPPRRRLIRWFRPPPMPQPTGLGSARRLRALRPDRPVRRTSRHGPRLTPAALPAAGVQEIRAKPSTLETLAPHRHVPENQPAVRDPAPPEGGRPTPGPRRATEPRPSPRSGRLCRGLAGSAPALLGDRSHRRSPPPAAAHGAARFQAPVAPPPARHSRAGPTLAHRFSSGV